MEPRLIVRYDLNNANVFMSSWKEKFVCNNRQCQKIKIYVHHIDEKIVIRTVELPQLENFTE